MYAMAGLIPKKDALNQFGMQTITVLMIITLVLVIMMEVSVKYGSSIIMSKVSQKISVMQT